jgi:hypothetical protein
MIFSMKFRQVLNRKELEFELQFVSAPGGIYIFEGYQFIVTILSQHFLFMFRTSKLHSAAFTDTKILVFQEKNRNIISDNIYANVDPAGVNFSRTHR